tara:strand:- start:47221 stop:48714 length:1494 start_codon:yes stop_codon:yes gene_type:complete
VSTPINLAVSAITSSSAILSWAIGQVTNPGGGGGEPSAGGFAAFLAQFLPEQTVPTWADRTHTASPTATVNGSGTDGSPWTMEQARTLAVAGNIVGLMPGQWYGGTPPRPFGDPLRRLYPAFRPENSGTASQPIWFVAQNPAATNTSGRTEIYSGSPDAWEGWPAFGSYGKNYIRFSGIYSDLNDPNGQNYVDTGLTSFREGIGCSIHKCHLIGKQHPQNNNNAAVRIEGIVSGEIGDNKIEGFRGNTNNAGITLYRSMGARIHHNDITDCFDAFHPKSKDSSFQFYGNKVYSCNQFARLLIPSYSGTAAEEGWIFNNTGNNLNKIIGMTTSDGPFRIDKVKVFNNTFNNIATANDPGAIYWSASPDSPRDNQFYNNIIHTAYAVFGSYRTYPGTAAEMAGFWTSDRNVFQGTTKFFNAGGLNAVTLAQWQAVGQDVNSVFANPSFTNRASGDFTLQAGSPALGLGRDKLGMFGPVDGVINAGARPTNSAEIIGIRG